VRGFERRLALIALAGLAVRVAYAIHNRDYPVQGDALTFHLEGGYVADGQGFHNIVNGEPTAEHPPLHILLIALVDLLGGNGFLSQKLALCLVGTGTVVLIGVAGRLLGGDLLGLVAAGIAALYPMLWLADGSLMSETTYAFFISAALVCALAYRRAPSLALAAGLGALIALAALTRGEGLALLVLLAVPLAWRRWRHVAAVVVAAVVVLAPWTIRNLTTFEKPFLVSTNSESLWAGTNCHRTYYTDQIGAWVLACYGPRPAGDESQQAAVYRDRGLRYMRDHLGRLPLVVAARLGRLWDLYKPWSQGTFFSGLEGRRPGATHKGLIIYWALLPLAVAGAVVLRARGRDLWILLAPIVMVTLVGITTYGTTRFRMAAEPSIVLLAAAAVQAAVVRVRSTYPRDRLADAGGRP
jgi:4-amino-4-deoxy-L-arabinose transferase-like glycosyltransferase